MKECNQCGKCCTKYSNGGLSASTRLRKEPHQNKYTCDIYFDRPDDCKYYPVTVEQMIQDDCEMIEQRDLANPKHTQKTLDKLMVDSRPAFE